MSHKNDLVTDVLESMSEAFFSLDRDWRYTYVNQKACEFFGQKPQDILGKELWTELPSGIGEPFTDSYKIVMEERRPITLEGYYTPRKRWFENRIFPTEQGISIFFSDITERKKTEIALKESEERFRILVEQAVDGIFHGDAEGNFIEVNSKGCDMTGFTKAELLQMNMQHLFTTQERERTPLRYDLLMQGVVVFNERVLTRKDGNTRIIEMHTKMMPDKTYQSIFRDVTERKRSEEQIRESENRYRTIFENTGTATIIIEEDTIISLANTKFEELSGYTKEEIENKVSWKIFVVKEDLDIMKQRHEQRRKDATQVIRSYEFRFYDKAGTIKDILLTIDLIPGTKKSVASLLDISDRKIIENRIKRINEELEVRVELRTKQLEEANRALAVLNNTKDKFFSIIAHDLKGPLAAIIISAEMLIKTLVNNPDNKERLLKYSENILWSTQEGHKLLENLLEWASAQTGVIEYFPQQHDLIECLKEAMAPMQLNLENKEISVIIPETPQMAYVDKNMVGTIFRNLLSNAIKYSHKGGTIVVRMETQKNTLLTEISDTGVGIPDSIKSILFRIDHKYSTPGTQNEKGIGLGLILCKEFIDKLGGTIWVESVVGKGSTFKFTLPIK